MQEVAKKIITKIDANPLLSKKRSDAETMRVAAYCRVSTDSEDQLESYKAQVAYYTDCISKNPKWKFVGIYADEGITGTLARKRENFLRMIHDCEKGKIDMILTKSVARFARNTVDSLRYIRELKALGISVYFEEQCLDTMKAESELALGLHSVLAQAESENISANVRWGIQRRMQTGTYKFRYNLIGYKKGASGQPEIVQEEAEYVRTIFNMFLDGNSVDQIKTYLDNEPIKTSTGNKIWCKNAIRNILTNERYVGDMILQKTYIENCITKKCKRNRGELPKYLISNNHPAIVERDIFKQVQTEIARRKNKRRISDETITEQSKYSGKYPLSELLVCGECGSQYRRWMWVSGGKKLYVWRCINRIEHGNRFCHESISVNDEILHKAVYRAIEKFACNKDDALQMIISELSFSKKGGSDDLYELEIINKKLKELDEQLEQASIFEASTDNNKDRLREEIIDLAQQIKLLRERKELINTKISTDSIHDKEIERYIKELSRLDVDITQMNDNRLRRFIHLIKVMPDKSIMLVLKSGKELVEKL